ncbi:MAG: hypothetical protein LQ352_002675 [Teloschistes flavicans]|nr:MAG: hypothetical protein LQ352_002675 [Teloschistes flavicans]
MARKNNETPSSNRVRDNQRRSRTRRAALLTDLQKRVHEYERQGIAATLEMQRAARKVAQDNIRLWSLLALHGISREEVESHLRSSDGPSIVPEAHLPNLLWSSVDRQRRMSEDKQVTSPVRHDPPLILESRYVNAKHTDVNSRVAPPQQQTSTPKLSESEELKLGSPARTHVPVQGVVEKENNSQDTSSLDDISHACSDTDPSACRDSLSCFCAPTPTDESGSASLGLEISCETAARIIAEMRGDGDNESVRASLGCGALEECNVRNTTVLQVMDER